MLAMTFHHVTTPTNNATLMKISVSTQNLVRRQRPSLSQEAYNNRLVILVDNFATVVVGIGGSLLRKQVSGVRIYYKSASCAFLAILRIDKKDFALIIRELGEKFFKEKQC